MTAALRLVIFDVDGTLVDSQGAIVAAMTAAFEAVDLDAPGRGDILSIVGLSLDHAMARLAPGQSASVQAHLVQSYKDAYFAQRQVRGAAVESPLYPGAREVIAALGARPDLLLGIATGKSRRGLTALLAAHAFEQTFVTTQTADQHPSKPHPSMIETAMAEAGVGPEDTVMIGDTSYDMDMAQAAGVPGIGVGWGYHSRRQLGAARRVIEQFDELPGVLDDIWKATT